MLILDKKKFEEKRKKLERRILNDSIDGAYLRNLVLKKDEVQVEVHKENLSPSTRIDDLIIDNDSRFMHR